MLPVVNCLVNNMATEPLISFLTIFFLYFIQSSDLIESSNSRRKELTLESLDGQDIIICKLWGEAADLVVPPIDSIITASCVQVAVWKGSMSLNSTNLTKLQVNIHASLFRPIVC